MCFELDPTPNKKRLGFHVVPLENNLKHGALGKKNILPRAQVAMRNPSADMPWVKTQIVRPVTPSEHPIQSKHQNRKPKMGLVNSPIQNGIPKRF